MKDNITSKAFISLTIVAITAIIAIMICCLAALGFNSRISIEKEKIEVLTNTDNNLHNQPNG